jgi:septal ring factor EnvC (AmiA/AmiB activator)
MSTFGNFDEFWAAMGRLYDHQLKHDEEIAELRSVIRDHSEQIRLTTEQMQQTDARLDRLASMIATLAGTVAKQSQEIESHERRLGRLEGD